MVIIVNLPVLCNWGSGFKKQMRTYNPQSLVKKSLFANNIIAGLLLLSYCLLYGVTAEVALVGAELIFFLSSFFFALFVMYVRDPEVQKKKIAKGILFNQTTGTILLITYLVAFGFSSIAFLNGCVLVFFMASYAHALSVFYLRDAGRLEKEEKFSYSTSIGYFTEKSPCFINSKDMSWLVRELNGSLSTIVGFTELMLERQYSEHEREYMLKQIYEEAITMSNSINKVANLITNSDIAPKHNKEIRTQS